MRDTLSSRRFLLVLGAATVLFLLAGSLAVRLLSRTVTGPDAPAASVPEPRPIEIKDLEIPYWAGREAGDWPLRFRTDLDALAPMGTGPANAAAWFKDFTKVPKGARFDEFLAACERRIEHPTLGKILPPDDPLLAEAEPWCDQATMRFYPDFYPIEGLSTPVPNLVALSTFAKSWVARGMSLADNAAALADFRRAVRLGRLLRQEDVTIVADLVGLGCIRAGTEAIYDRARAMGDTELALVAAVVMSEVAPQRLLTSARLTEIELFSRVQTAGSGSLQLSASDGEIQAVIEAATSSPERRFRGEAIANLGATRFWGTPPQQELARRVLDELARDKDPIVAATARCSRDVEPPATAVLDIATVTK